MAKCREPKKHTATNDAASSISISLLTNMCPYTLSKLQYPFSNMRCYCHIYEWRASCLYVCVDWSILNVIFSQLVKASETHEPERLPEWHVLCTCIPNIWMCPVCKVRVAIKWEQATRKKTTGVTMIRNWNVERMNGVGWMVWFFFLCLSVVVFFIFTLFVSMSMFTCVKCFCKYFRAEWVLWMSLNYCYFRGMCVCLSLRFPPYIH